MRPSDGRAPLVLLERETHVQMPRSQLLEAIRTKAMLSRALGLSEFMLNRYFLQEPLSSSFHMDGIMMFGCCPHSASLTFDGYAKLFNRERVAVFKEEPPLHIVQDGESYQLPYQNTAVWSHAFGAIGSTRYSKQRYQLVRLKLDESFFHLWGALMYQVIFDESKAPG